MPKGIKRLLARLASARVRELEVDLASLQDCIADAVLEEYTTHADWHHVAVDLLKEMGVWEKLRDDRR